MNSVDFSGKLSPTKLFNPSLKNKEKQSEVQGIQWNNALT